MSKLFKLKTLPKIVKIIPNFKPKRIKGCLTSIGKSEDIIQNEILYFLTQEGIPWWVLDIKGKPFVRRGVIHFQRNENSGFGDILICLNGYFIMIEVKKCGGVQSDIQQYQENKVIKNGGGQYWIITSVKELKEYYLYFLESKEKKNG